MEEKKFEDIYKIDKKRLLNYYERIKNQSQSLEHIQIVAQFLNNQSIGPSAEIILTILSYYEDKLIPDRNLLDFAFEWIRAHKIRLEYKKYIIRAKYPVGHLALAIDDSISSFFLEYDKFVRDLLKENIYEYEISALYYIFFSSLEAKDIDLHLILDFFRTKVPTNFSGNKKIDSCIITLRSAFSLIIVKDFEAVLFSRSHALKETSEFQKHVKVSSKELAKLNTFRGPLIERIIKTYCLKKGGLSSKEIEKAGTAFLSSHLKFGQFYHFDEFIPALIHSLAVHIYSGLTDKFKRIYPLSKIKALSSKYMQIFKDTNKFDLLDGSAWINDLKPYLKIAILDFTFHLIEDNFDKVSPQSKVIKHPQDKSEINIYDFESNFNLSLDVDEFRNQLEEHLKELNIGLIERRNIVRVKVQEFQNKKRKSLK